MLIRTQFPDLNLTTALPAIEELIYEAYEKKPEQYSRYFNVKTAPKGGIVQSSGITGLGLPTTINEGGDVRYDDIVATGNKTYTHVRYGLGFKVSRLMIDDDKFGVVQTISKNLGRSFAENTEIVAADIINNGFATAGSDGKVLFATDHPLYKSGGTGTNALATPADLDVTSLELAISDMRKTKNHSGIKRRLSPNKLVVAVDNQFNAAQILAGTMRSDTQQNTVNAFRHMDQNNLTNYEVWDYLTDPDAWFLWCDKDETDLNFYWREKFNVRHGEDFDSEGSKTAAAYRFSVGYQEWFGVYGSPGA